MLDSHVKMRAPTARIIAGFLQTTMIKQYGNKASQVNGLASQCIQKYVCSIKYAIACVYKNNEQTLI